LLFRDHRDSASLSAKTVSHCRRFGVVFGRKVTRECAMWRIAGGQAPGGPVNIRPDNSEARRLPTAFALATPAGHGHEEASFGIARQEAAGRARRGGVKRTLTLAG
jgi:hypothetical protein